MKAKKVFLLASVLGAALALGSCQMLSTQTDTRSITAVEKTETNGLVDTYKIVFSDGTTTTFEIVNGKDGENGQDGIKGAGIEDVEINYKGEVTITLDTGEQFTVTVQSPSCDFLAVSTSPTCGEKGYTTYTCKDCNLSYINDYVAPTGHHYIDKYCTFCGEEQPFGVIAYQTTWYDSSKSRFELSTKEELAGLAYLVNNGNTFSGKTIVLSNDVDLSSEQWIPIGTNEHPFSGTFDGQSFTVKNLNISYEDSYVGFFGYSNGTIKRVNVSGANINVSGENSFVGALCGYANYIEDVSVSGYVVASDSSYVGGIVGKISKGTSGNITYDKLVNNAEVTGKDYVGGLIGELYNSYYWYDTTGMMTFSDSANTGKITGNDNVGGLYGNVYHYNSHAGATINAYDLENTGDVTGNKNVGGIGGHIYSESGEVKNSESSATVKGISYLGGLFGKAENVMLNSCKNTGSQVISEGYEITSSGDYVTYLGGFVGQGYGATNCVNEVAITYEYEGRYIGGLIGYGNYIAGNCSNNAPVKAENSSWVGGVYGRISKDTAGSITYDELVNNAEVTGKDYVGGLIGELYTSYYWYDTTGTLTFSCSVNTGKITGNDNVGGLYGNVYHYNTHAGATINGFDNKNTGDVTGNKNVGGIAGHMYTESSSTFKNSESSATVKGISYLGGLFGKAENVILDSCKNTGSQVISEGYEITSNGDYVTYLGGFVGQGYGVRNCVNEVAITYEYEGRYIGGLMGYGNYVADNCSNNAPVKAENSSWVGGICGKISKDTAGSIAYDKLVNNAEVTGKDYVGGLIGELYNSYYWYDTTGMMTLSCSVNTGKITGDDNVGGLYGKVYHYNTHSGAKISAFDNENTGDVTGDCNVGGIAGYIYTETGSSVEKDRLINSGVIVAKEKYDNIFGESSNITLTVSEE